MHFFREIFSVIKTLTLEQNADTRANLYLEMVNYLCVAAQETYPYHVEKVDSNDTLYGHDQNFLKTIDNLRDDVVQEILSYLKLLGENSLFKRQSVVALDCFFRLIIHGDISKIGKLAFNLWQLVLKNNCFDSATITKDIKFVDEMAQVSGNFDLQSLSKKMASLIN